MNLLTLLPLPFVALSLPLSCGRGPAVRGDRLDVPFRRAAVTLPPMPAFSRRPNAQLSAQVQLWRGHQLPGRTSPQAAAWRRIRWRFRINGRG